MAPWTLKWLLFSSSSSFGLFVNSWSHTACLLVLAGMLTEDPALHERTLTVRRKSRLTGTSRCQNERQVTFAPSRTTQQNPTLSDTYYTTLSFLFVFSTTEIPSRRSSQVFLIHPTTYTGKPTVYFHFPRKIRPRNGTQYRTSQCQLYYKQFIQL